MNYQLGLIHPCQGNLFIVIPGESRRARLGIHNCFGHEAPDMDSHVYGNDKLHVSFDSYETTLLYKRFLFR